MLALKEDISSPVDEGNLQVRIRDPELDWSEDEKQILFDIIRSTRSDTTYVWTPVDRCLFVCFM